MFELRSSYEPRGDQPQAIEKLVEGVKDGLRTQVLLGVTGSGKTFTMANVIKRLNRPALVIAHNKTLAAQLCNEFREFFPENRVEYFVSYYDYYQPEAYIPRSDTYIEKDMSVNDEIDRLRNSATSSLCERRDVIVVASVSCIYGLGAPMEYFSMAISLREGMTQDRDELIDRLIEIQYDRSDLDLQRASFRVRGDVVEIVPVENDKIALKIEFFGDEIESITQIDPLTGKAIARLKHVNIFPASHYVVEKEKREAALRQIGADMIERVKYFEERGKLIEAQRIRDVRWLAQGTIYPDVIESCSVNGPSATIKSHHNVGGLPEKMNLRIVEPLRLLFKDEVRRVGRSLGISERLIGRHPFPGPGLAIRILGDITPEKVDILQQVDKIFIDALHAADLYNKVWQAGAILLPVKSVGVMGDERTYESCVALRAVTSTDGMTADWVHLPYEFLADVSNEIINKVRGVNRVVYDISSKPPATIEWE